MVAGEEGTWSQHRRELVLQNRIAFQIVSWNELSLTVFFKDQHTRVGLDFEIVCEYISILLCRNLIFLMRFVKTLPKLV